MYVYGTKMYIYSTYSTHTLDICMSLEIKSYTTYDKVINPLVQKKHVVLNANFVFDLHEIFKECNPGINKACLYTNSAYICNNN
jgi:hypothetical protein